MKGYKDKNGKFHPIKKYKGVRKRRSQSTVDGIKIVKNTNSQQMLNGITNSLNKHPKKLKKEVKTITIKDKQSDEDFVAKVDTDAGEITLNKKPLLSEGDYEALTDHELEHIDFNDHLKKGEKKYEQFIKDANRIAPFTPDLMMTLAEQEEAFIEGNFGILPDKRLEYPDEINSVVKEIETRERLGLPTNILNEEEFKKAKHLVEQLHKDGKIRKAIGINFDEPNFVVMKVKNENLASSEFRDQAKKNLNERNFIETKNLGEAIRAVDEGKGNIIMNKDTLDVMSSSLKKRDVIVGKTNKPDSFFDKKQLEIGTKIELEHTNSKEVAKRIAKDHLEESPKYYKELVKLERKLGI